MGNTPLGLYLLAVPKTGINDCAISCWQAGLVVVCASAGCTGTRQIPNTTAINSHRCTAGATRIVSSPLFLWVIAGRPVDRVDTERALTMLAAGQRPVALSS